MDADGLQYGHGNAAWTWTSSMYWDMQHRHEYGLGHSVWILSCSMDMNLDMQHVLVHVHASWPRTCSMSKCMLHVQFHTAVPCPCCMSMFILQVMPMLHYHAHAAWPCPCWRHVHAACMYMSMLYALFPCSLIMFMLISMSTFSMDMDMQHGHMI